ncbi:diguanylate cyclase/phosphodiesterase (GGDEF & EAL domains) with PAS/PAC sensor(s) [hydrothermal vent metagenome]|uniref:Diguanylate cyclase/phosphodiesterase (GGDEF & EAL domains) with PAS/PAC sensor(S) n=1 Tax=hydrothermal vent metagenome TaxID=652676 RepID=A0A3B1BW08_9ZZZZ
MKTKTSGGKNESKLIELTRQHSEALTECVMEIFALYHVSKTLNISLSMDDIFGEAEEQMKELLDITEFSVMLLDNDTSILSVWKASSALYEDIKEITFKVGQGICGLVAETGEPITVGDTGKDKRFVSYGETQQKITSLFSAPLKSRNGKVIGVFNVHKDEPYAFKERDTLIYNAVATHIAQAVENSQLYNKTKNQAITEGLTKLYSKQYFMEVLQHEISDAKRRKSNFSVLMLDVDNFKAINDTYGHPEGDAVLKKIASTLKENTRKGDVLARYGGDEIIVFLRGTDRSKAMYVANKLLDNIRENVNANGGSSKESNGKITISAGVACFPESGDNINDIIKSADKALYAAKDFGRDRACLAPKN